MRILLLFLLFLSSIIATEINHKFANPMNCIGCHKEQVSDWQTTWHSHAHEAKNPLFNKVVTYVRKTAHESRADVLTRCAKCHNPKLQIKKVDESYMYAKAFGIETKTTKKVDNALNAEHTKTGISCFICHNIDKIDPKKTPKNGGLDIVHWTTGNLIVGPFEANNRAGFHESAQREHFIKGNTLCLTCHQGSANYNDLDGYQTGEEIATQADAPRCVECHMSSSRKGIIAPNITRAGEDPEVRNIRSHLFAGARNSKILETTLGVFIKANKNTIDFSIKNLTPHRVPTGFTGRSMEVDFTFYKGKSVIGKQKVKLRAKYKDKYGNEALSYVAKEMVEDTRLNPNELRVLTMKRPKGVTLVKVDIWYYLVSPSLQKILEIDDEIFTKKYLVTSVESKL